MSQTADVVVIGGGCEGTSIAWQLARRKAGHIVLLEKRGIAAGATGWSSAIIRQHYTHEPLARMALYALRMFERFGEAVGGDAGFHRTGFLALVKPEDVQALTANVAMNRRVGIDSRMLTREDLRSLEPRMAADDVGGAVWEPESGYADPVGTTHGYVEAGRHLGVEYRIGVRADELRVGPLGVEGVETNEGLISTRTVVVAAGFLTRDLVMPLGIDVPLTPIRHSIAIVQRSAGFGPEHMVISDRINGSYYRPEGAELTLIGTTAADEGTEDPEVEVDRSPSADETAVLAGRYCRRFPSEDLALLRRGYTGVYDCSPDLQPLLGPVPGLPGLNLAVGFSGHGFKLSPAIGDLISEQVVTGRTSLVPIAMFSPSRFAEQRLMRAEHAYSVSTLG